MCRQSTRKDYHKAMQMLWDQGYRSTDTERMMKELGVERCIAEMMAEDMARMESNNGRVA